ncbi:unnamed protein product [Gulo gulo]|uniref:Uncharacterized protein n=1 Tax=Gulo gulo TaxID=48420 RepID=A0A9X9M266_GULGU|nr:unnamed protein product [Gulo gulo]
MKLLAQRHAELQQCEFLGDEILQSSKQFQRMSKRTMRKYKLKNIDSPVISSAVSINQETLPYDFVWREEQHRE